MKKEYNATYRNLIVYPNQWARVFETQKEMKDFLDSPDINSLQFSALLNILKELKTLNYEILTLRNDIKVLKKKKRKIK